MNLFLLSSFAEKAKASSQSNGEYNGLYIFILTCTLLIFTALVKILQHR